MSTRAQGEAVVLPVSTGPGGAQAGTLRKTMATLQLRPI
jgi:hypothetical protein